MFIWVILERSLVLLVVSWWRMTIVSARDPPRPCAVRCVVYSVQYSIQNLTLNTWTMYYALNTMHLNYALCSIHYALCTMHSTRDPPRPPATWCIAKGGPTTPSWPQLWKFCGCCLNCEGSQNDKENFNCADEFEEWSLIHGAFFSSLDLTKWHRPVRSPWHVLFQFIPGPSPAQNSQHS